MFTAHDAGHRGITHNFVIDTLIGIFIADVCCGMSIGWWKCSHNVHHLVTNQPVSIYSQPTTSQIANCTRTMILTCKMCPYSQRLRPTSARSSPPITTGLSSFGMPLQILLSDTRPGPIIQSWPSPASIFMFYPGPISYLPALQTSVVRPGHGPSKY